MLSTLVVHLIRILSKGSANLLAAVHLKTLLIQ